MTSYSGVTWRVNYGEVSEREQFRVGRLSLESYDAYFPLSQLQDLIDTLNAVTPLGLNVIARGNQVQAVKVSDGLLTSVVISPRLDTGTPVESMRLPLSELTDLLYALGLFRSDASAFPDDWDFTKPNPIHEASLPKYLQQDELNATIATLDLSFANADAMVDFTKQPDGAPATKLDTGQDVDYTLQLVSNRAPVIDAGKLKHGPSVGTGSYANYYQALLDGDCRMFGTQYVTDSSTGTTAGVMCLAAWASVFEAGGNVPPRTPGHITINMLTNAWEWWVSDGGGPGSTHLKSIKQGTFTAAPAKDGVVVWSTACLIDPDNGIGYLLLPGVDTATGKRIVTLTNAEIAAFLTAVSLPVVTFAQLCAGAKVLMIEHYAVSNANTAIYPEFLSVFGEVSRPARETGRTLRTAATSPAGKALRTFATARTQALTASAANITDGTSACAIVAAAGPTGVIEFELEGYVLFTGAETVLGRMAGPTNTTNEPVAKLLGLGSGETQRAVPVRKTWRLSGLTPNATGTWTLQMSAATSGGLASVVFGGSGAGYPPLVLKATPL